MRRFVVIGVVIGSMAVGGVVGALVFSAASATAQSSPSNRAPQARWGDARGWHGPFGPGFGPHEAVSDTSVAARAIGISEADLLTALRGGSSIAQVARQHGVDVSKVVDALVADAQGELAAAVKDGRITQAQADQAKAGLVGRVTAQVNAPGGMFPPPPFGPGGRFGFGFGPFEDLAVAAKTIGVLESDLVSALRGGSSIAQVARQHRIDVTKVVDALVANAKTHLAAAVKAGRITQAQADAISADLRARINERVNAPGLGCGPGHPGGQGVGHGGFPGAGWDDAQASA